MDGQDQQLRRITVERVEGAEGLNQPQRHQKPEGFEASFGARFFLGGDQITDSASEATGKSTRKNGDVLDVPSNINRISTILVSFSISTISRSNGLQQQRMAAEMEFCFLQGPRPGGLDWLGGLRASQDTYDPMDQVD